MHTVHCWMQWSEWSSICSPWVGFIFGSEHSNYQCKKGDVIRYTIYSTHEAACLQVKCLGKAWLILPWEQTGISPRVPQNEGTLWWHKEHASKIPAHTMPSVADHSEAETWCINSPPKMKTIKVILCGSTPSSWFDAQETTLENLEVGEM